MDYIRAAYNTPIFWPIFGAFMAVILMFIATQLIYRHRRMQVKHSIEEAPQIAANMVPGQTVVKNLVTINDEKISEFLAPFTADQFTVKITNKRVGNDQSNHLVTILTITKKLNEY